MSKADNIEHIDTAGVTAIYGGRGAGKTYFAKQKIFPQLGNSRVLVIDPIETNGCRTALEIRDLMYSGARRMVLCSGEWTEAFAAIYTAWAHSTPDDPIYAICDEAPEYFYKNTPMLRKIMYQGRHRKFGMCLMGQQPNSINAKIRSQAATTFFMRLSDHNDVSVAAQSLGADRARSLQGFTQGQYIRHPPYAKPANTNQKPNQTKEEWG
ncbi:hypothetical protein JI58_02265 [Marinosulfonomonas sp. PRT-SC04]|nr:hypothetical protein JI58_02265 [Marinosulfonomonas sp. PRT-SC04]